MKYRCRSIQQPANHFCTVSKARRRSWNCRSPIESLVEIAGTKSKSLPRSDPEMLLGNSFHTNHENIMVRNVCSKAACLMALSLSGASGHLLAAERPNPASVLVPFVSGDSFAAGYFDVASLDLPKNREAILNLDILKILPQLPQDVQSAIVGVAMAETLAEQFRDAGGQSIYVLAGLGDVHIGGGPVSIATTRADAHPEGVEQFFRTTI